ncbi:MAG TPA: PEP/pyruvate-binding domain-containing protein [Anaerolineales bacterium]|jgi:pyruvate,water dikinase
MTMQIIPFSSPDASIEIAGGKGANLARLSRAGFNVPRGFILPTSAYQAFVAENDLQALIMETIKGASPGATLADDPNTLESASAKIRAAFSVGRLPVEVAASLRQAYAGMEAVPVAVRSSATAEDLPDFSFAGQQDTFLNIQGLEQLEKAVIDCWSSLWTARAIGYRLRNDIPNQGTALAVVIQEMVESAVSGVLFTANPLTGRLDETVIDAAFGLGEALVSGQVEPDHYVVNSQSGELKSFSLGAKGLSIRSKSGGGVEKFAGDGSVRQTLSDGEAQELTRTGQAIQKAFDSPQDIEWALAGGRFFILQARAITSLFPVPFVSFDPLVLWFSFGAVQGLVGPLTPLGRDTLKNVAASATPMFGMKPDPANFKIFDTAGERIWIKISDLIRNPLGKNVFQALIGFVEPSVGKILKPLSEEPGVGQGQGRLRLVTIWRLVYFAVPVMARLAHNMAFPQKARDDFDRAIEGRLAEARVAPAADRFGRLAAVLALMRGSTANVFRFLMPKFIPVFGPAMGSLNLLRHLSGDYNLTLEVTRSLPRNVTTEMDIELWKTAEAIRAVPVALELFQAADPAVLARLFQLGSLPDVAQSAIDSFMQRYGMRGVGEIDFGQLRWRDDPAPIMHTLQSYLNSPAEFTPGVMFARGEQASLAAIEQIAAKVRAQPGGWFKEKLVRAAALRIRLLMGARESPKFFAVRNIGIARKALLEVGREFVEAGTIERADDLVFLNLAELEELSRQANPPDGEERNWKSLIATRRASYERELKRRQVPRVLASDGRAFFEGVGADTDSAGAISGSPVSPGVAEGIVHIVLDPRSAHLAQGEILVCPGTDPAWTPLFMVAGGLITEVGGMMTHGSVVAREYGIPAVVGVHEATTRLKDGQRIRLDGSSGKIQLLDEATPA